MKKQGTRVKSKAIISIADWPKADQMVRKIGSIQRTIEKTESKYRARSENIKNEMVQEVKPLQDRIGVLQRSLEAFAVSHKPDFKKQRSKKLNFGVLGWRKSTSTKIQKNTIDLIRKFFSEAKAKIYIRSRETVDKEALSNLPDGQLKKIGAERTTKEVFFIEPASPKTVVYG